MSRVAELSSPGTVAASGYCPRCRGEAYITLFRATDRLYRTTTQRFNLVECSACGLIRLDPPPTPEELASFYPDQYWWDADESASGRLGEIYRQLVLQDHVSFVRSGLSDEAPLLDIGCGGGAFLHALQRRGYDVVGADTSPIAASIVNRKFGIPAVCGALPYPPFKPYSFGAVTLFHVLEHLPDPLAAVYSLSDLMIPGGRLIIQVPNAACWQLLLLGDRWSGLDVPRHLIHFRVEDLEDLLDACGLEIRRRKFFSLRDNPASLATSLCPWLEPVSRRVRKVQESRVGAILRDCLYLALVVASVPFTLLEAASTAGSTVMVDAARKGER